MSGMGEGRERGGRNRASKLHEFLFACYHKFWFPQLFFCIFGEVYN